MISANLSAIFYLVSGVLFILALRGLSSPETMDSYLLGIQPTREQRSPERLLRDMGHHPYRACLLYTSDAADE